MTPKAAARSAVTAYAGIAIALSRALHAEPETAWQEVKSAARVAEALAGAG